MLYKILIMGLLLLVAGLTYFTAPLSNQRGLAVRRNFTSVRLLGLQQRSTHVCGGRRVGKIPADIYRAVQRLQFVPG